jgi:hypothetical protein
MEEEKKEKEFATRAQEKRLLAMLVQYFPEGQLPFKQAQDLIEHRERLVAAFLKMVQEHQIPPPKSSDEPSRRPSNWNLWC